MKTNVLQFSPSDLASSTALLESKLNPFANTCKTTLECASVQTLRFTPSASTCIYLKPNKNPFLIAGSPSQISRSSYSRSLEYFE
jgi:hypothetical protein